jgi:hypothetical protein
MDQLTPELIESLTSYFIASCIVFSYLIGAVCGLLTISLFSN